MGAHPRSSGENDLRLIAGMGPQGSSPLTRGKLFRKVRDDLSLGLIPAHARKTTPGHPTF